MVGQKHIVLALAVLILAGLIGAVLSNLNNQPSVMGKIEENIPTSNILPNQLHQPTAGTSATPVSPAQSKGPKQYEGFPLLSTRELSGKKAVITTDKGVIEFEIYPEATKAASSFIFLAREKFFDNLIFHRVVPGFVIQGGDPFGEGYGGPGYNFEDEPVSRAYHKGIVAMANSGPNTNGSQFFIMLEDSPGLDPKYTIFGKVTQGMDVVEKIVPGDVMKSLVIF